MGFVLLLLLNLSACLSNVVLELNAERGWECDAVVVLESERKTVGTFYAQHNGMVVLPTLDPGIYWVHIRFDLPGLCLFFPFCDLFISKAAITFVFRICSWFRMERTMMLK